MPLAGGALGANKPLTEVLANHERRLPSVIASMAQGFDKHKKKVPSAHKKFKYFLRKPIFTLSRESE